MKINDKIEMLNMDNMDLLRNTPDNFYDLAVVDPPYGINVTKINMGSRKRAKHDSAKSWDTVAPNALYFNELLRCSKVQIIWGGNYFNLPTSQYFAIWDKGETMYGRDFAECELALCSKGGTRIFKMSPNQLQRIHPTQKPAALYEWIFKNYAKPGDKILDTHLGSASIAIALHNMNTIEGMNLSLTGCELDPDYYRDSIERVQKHVRQKTIFEQVAQLISEQKALF